MEKNSSLAALNKRVDSRGSPRLGPRI